jgi:dienelactone hydrolase
MRMKSACHIVAFGALGLILFGGAESTQAGGETFRDVVFADYSERSSSTELVRRMLSPLAALQLKRQMARTGKQMAQQSIKLAEEKFVVYIPSPRPARGYALLVFVPPWEDARLPSGWTAVLDRYGVIFVSAARSGNDESVFDRREPLALLAAHNAMQRYSVDPERVYIGGFSGGARVALRLALGYPDQFRGAILNAGSDPIGDSQIPIPPKDLFLQFQSTHLVYVTGEGDTARLNDDLASAHSMKKWCVFDVQSHVVRSGGHEVADSTALAWALSALLHDARPDPNKLDACRLAIEEALNLEMQALDSLVAAGHDDEAQKLLLKIDRHFGGLAAPRSVELAH